MKILFVTANENETSAFLESGQFKYKKERSPDKHDTNFYHVGKFGLYDAVHFELIQQGSVGSDAAELSILRAIGAYDPCAVILTGVAFGKENSDAASPGQHIGDVLISEKVADYESGKIKNGELQSDGVVAESGRQLFSVFKHYAREWEHWIDGRKCKCEFGLLLSGDKVVDDRKFKGNLLKAYPRAIGGEMEGRGAYAACRSQDLNEWIIIKAICDWADGTKGVNKEEQQRKAAKAAVSLLEYVFCREEAFSQWNDCEKEAVPIMKAVEKIHQEGIVHRDARPDNIQIQKNGRWVLLDRGMARSGEADNGGERLPAPGFSLRAALWALAACALAAGCGTAAYLAAAFLTGSHMQETVYEKRDSQIGAFLGDKADGPCVELWESGRIKRIGEYRAGKPDGFGAEYDSFGELLYAGEYADGKREGVGVSFSGGKAVYLGEWKNGREDGLGTRFSESGALSGIWEGERFLEEKETGIESDTYEFSDGPETYTGYRIGGAWNGLTYTSYGNGSYYIGNLENGYRNGTGLYCYSDEKKNGEYCYFGQEKDGKCEGPGMMYYKNQSCYIGEWIKGERDGEGTLILSDGSENQSGIWKNDKLQKKESD